MPRLLLVAIYWSLLPFAVCHAAQEVQQRRQLRGEGDDVKQRTTNRVLAVTCLLAVVTGVAATTICMFYQRLLRHGQVHDYEWESDLNTQNSPANKADPTKQSHLRPAKPPNCKRPRTPEQRPVSLASYLQEISSPAPPSKPEPRKLIVRERMYPPRKKPAPLDDPSEAPEAKDEAKAEAKGLEYPGAFSPKARQPPRPSSAPISPGPRRSPARPTSAPGLTSNRRREDPVNKESDQVFRAFKEAMADSRPTTTGARMKSAGGRPHSADEAWSPKHENLGKEGREAKTPSWQPWHSHLWGPGKTAPEAPSAPKADEAFSEPTAKPGSPKSPSSRGRREGAGAAWQPKEKRHWSLWSLFRRTAKAPEVLPTPPLDPAVHASMLIDEMLQQLDETRDKPLGVRKNVFRELQRRLHPDKNHDDPET